MKFRKDTKKKYIDRIIKAKKEKALERQDEQLKHLVQCNRIVVSGEGLFSQSQTGVKSMIKHCCAGYTLRKQNPVNYVDQPKANAFKKGEQVKINKSKKNVQIVIRDDKIRREVK